MSEKTETIEDRAWNALNTIKHVTRWLKERADVSVDSDYGWRANYSALKSTHKILDDLMAEREKLKEPGMNTIHLSDGEMSIIYDALREYELLYSLAMRPEVEEALKTASTKMATVVFAKED